MSLQFNLRHLENKNLILRGQLTPAEMEIETRDAMVRVCHPLVYEVELQKVEEGVLAWGRLALQLECTCVRCLKDFIFPLELDGWSRLLPLSGEEAVPVDNDIVDLTPILREDMLLDFPQHPLCEPECGGLPQYEQMKSNQPPAAAPDSPWAVLDQLKLDS